MRLLVALAVLSLTAPAFAADLYGQIKLSPDFWKKKSSKRRLALPAHKVPVGFYVAVDGESFKGQDFGAPQPDKAALAYENGGFATRLSAVMVGGQIEIDNKTDAALDVTINGEAQTIEAKSKKAVTADKAGIATVKKGDSSVLVVVAASPYIIDLDETGEFAFEGLADGDYKVTVFGYAHDGQLGVVHEQVAHLQGGRTTLAIALGASEGTK